MKIACFTFTKFGDDLAHKLKQVSEHRIDIIGREQFGQNLKKRCKEAFVKYEALIFFSSTGIAVRLIAPYIRDKKLDPAVVVIDDMGRYVISLLSGHIGGANELARYISQKMNMQAIITTASDARNFEAVDVFACRNDYIIENMEDAKKITAMMVEGEEIELISELPVTIKYGNIVREKGDAQILVTTWEQINANKPYVVLRPKILHIGIGCRRGVPGETIIRFIEEVFSKNNLSTLCIQSIGTITLKKEEDGILEACEYFGCPLRVFTEQEIVKVQHRFKGSSFVQAAVGVKSVAEPCAYLCGGKILIPRLAKKGVALAVSKEV